MQTFTTAILAALLTSPLLLAEEPVSRSAAVKQSAGSSYFEAEDIFALEYASDVQISPDGSKIVYVRASNDIMTDSTRTSLWLLDVKSGRQLPLFADKFNYSQPRWSADSQQLALSQIGVVRGKFTCIIWRKIKPHSYPRCKTARPT